MIRKFLDNGKTSWRTTTFGILQFLGVLFGQLNLWFDADPASMPDFNLIYLGFMNMLALINARDNGVNDEQANVPHKTS